MSTIPETCPLCAHRQKTFKVAASHVYAGKENQKFFLCEKCDVVFLFPRLTLEDEKLFYANEFSGFMEKRAAQDFDWSGPRKHLLSNEKQFKRRWPFFQDLVAPEKTVLEIGCSSGFMLLPIKEKGCHVVGIEPSRQFTSFLKHNDITVFSSTRDLLDMNGSHSKFDLILHFFVLEHIRNPCHFLKDALGLLDDDGTMVFEVPNRDDPLISIYNIDAFHRFYWSVAHNYYFNRKSLRFVLDQLPCEYEIINEQRYDLSNHMKWALEGKPGGQGEYSAMFTPELEEQYLESMKQKGCCDTSIVRLKKNGVQK